MFCDELLDRVDAIASGDVPLDERVNVHLRSCPDCRAALDDARTLERVLRARPVPQPPPQFTSRVMARLRRQRWRSEQVLDLGFNVALAGVAILMLGSLWVVLTRSGLVSVGNSAAGLLGAGFAIVARRVAASLPLYAGATALVATALAIWWWAERDAAM